jgi:hypothetical protein
MTEEERQARGQRALQEYAEVEGAFAQVEAAILRTLSETPVGQDAKVLKLHMAVQNLAAVKQAIRDVIDDGQMATAAIASAGLTRPN